MKGKKWPRPFVALLIAAMMVILAACSGGSGSDAGSSNPPSGHTGGTDTDSQAPSEQKGEPLKLSIMVPAFSTELPDKSSPVWQRLEEYTHTDLEIIWTPNSSYSDKLNITLASGELPTIINVGKEPSVISAVRNGAFWEVGPYLKDYPNLSQANEIVLNNTSIDGKIYGVYRARTLGRMGVTYNMVWLENLGLEPAKNHR